MRQKNARCPDENRRQKDNNETIIRSPPYCSMRRLHARCSRRVGGSPTRIAGHLPKLGLGSAALHDSAVEKIQRHLIEYAPGVRGPRQQRRLHRTVPRERGAERGKLRPLRSVPGDRQHAGPLSHAAGGRQVSQRGLAGLPHAGNEAEAPGVHSGHSRTGRGDRQLHRHQRDLFSLPCMATLFLGGRRSGLPRAALPSPRKIRRLSLEDAGFRRRRPAGAVVHLRHRRGPQFPANDTVRALALALRDSSRGTGRSRAHRPGFLPALLEQPRT